MANVNLGIDNAYNAPLRKRAQELERMQIIQLQPQMLGGGPVREYALPGNNGALPVEIPLETGGAMRKQGFAKALRTYGRAVKPLGKTIKPLKEALVDAAVEGLEGGRQSAVRKQGFAKALRTYGRAVKPLAKTMKPLKEALVDAARASLSSTASPYAVEGLEGGRQSAVRKQGFAKALRTYGRAVKPMGKTIAPLKHALVDAAVEGLQYGAGARKDLPAGASSTKARMQALRDIQDRAPIFVKGSPEAKAHMAELRAKRVKKPPREKKPPGARALVVKRVMADEGLSMIEASKFVKKHGLYTKQ